MRAILSALSAVTMVAGCAQNPKEIAPSYVSPVLYQSYSCEQIALEAQRVSARAVQVTGTQEQKASGDAVAMGVGLIFFWPAIFFIKGDRQSAAELARLRGELDALQQAAIAKNCGLQIQVYEPPPKTQPNTPTTPQPGQKPVASTGTAAAASGFNDTSSPIY